MRSHGPNATAKQRAVLVHALLVGLVVGLLSLVLWKNCDKIREILGQQIDLRLFGLAFLVAQIGLLVTFVWKGKGQAIDIGRRCL